MRLASSLSAIISIFSLSAQSSHTLRADGTTDTYKLISDAGFFAETTGNQSPDDFMMHSSFRHISQIYDSSLDSYVFAFDIHVDFNDNGKTVTDGNKAELVDRQRNEIKCMDAVPETVASDGQTIAYNWKFKLPEGMKTTGEFCHIHQIKGLGSGEEVAHPVFTLTCRTAGSRQVLQVINVPYEGASNVNLAQLELSPLLGRWIEARESFTVGKHGSYRLKLIDVATGNVLVSIDKADIQVWRDTSDRSTMRGKWGIYRSLGSNLGLKSQLRSERILFADIEADKSNSSVGDILADEPDDDDTIYDLFGRSVVSPSPGIYIKNHKKIIIK